MQRNHRSTPVYFQIPRDSPQSNYDKLDLVYNTAQLDQNPFRPSDFLPRRVYTEVSTSSSFRAVQL